MHAATGLTAIANQYASYDVMGNMTCRNVDPTPAHSCDATQTGATMTYDNEGRLDTWNAPSGTTASDQFLYDNSGNRVLQRSSTTTGSTTAVTDTITFDGYTEVTISGGNTSTIKYYRANEQSIAMRKDGTLYYLLPDFLGNNTVVLKSDGSVQSTQLFAPFGATRYSDGTLPTTYSFTGQRLDSQTGLLYYNFRYYDPLSGRFTRADTIDTNAIGRDGYAYAEGNPETLKDPSGHDATPWYQQAWNWITSNPIVVAAAEVAVFSFAAFALIAISVVIMESPPATTPSYSVKPEPVPTPTTITPTPTSSDPKPASQKVQEKAKEKACAKSGCKDVDLDLTSSEAKLGHTLRDHVFKTDQQMEDAVSDPQSDRYRGPYGRFFSQADAQRAVYYAIAQGKGVIDSKGDIVYENVPVGFPVGTVYTYNGSKVGVDNASRVTVVISPLTCSVKTAYPVV